MNWTYLLFLACPISMVLMMWWMMRMDQGSHPQHSGPTAEQARIAELESQVYELKAAISSQPREEKAPHTL